jgi:hypothetical protein
MNVAFIVQINLDDLSDLPGQAMEIQQDLQDAGFDVKAVAPWQRPSLGLGNTGGLFSPEQTQTTNPNL